MSWAIRRRNGGVDINEEMSDDPSLYGPSYGEWVEIVRLADVLEALRSLEGDYELCGFGNEAAVWLERKFGSPPNQQVKSPA